MPFLTQGKTNWKFLLIVVVLAAIVGGGIFWCTVKEKTKPPETQPPEKLEIEKIINEVLPVNFTKEATNYFIDDLNEDGKSEIIITAAIRIENDPGQEGYFSVVTILDEEGNYEKVGELEYEAAYRGIPVVIEVKDIDNDNQKEIFLSLTFGGASTVAEGILTLDFVNQKLDWIKFQDENGNTNEAIFYIGASVMHQHDYTIEDLDEDGQKEIIKEDRWGEYEKPDKLEPWEKLVPMEEEGTWWRYEVKVYEWNGSIFSYDENLSKEKLSTIEEKEKEVIIITDKTEYEQGEMVKITVRNGLDKSIWYPYASQNIFSSPPSWSNLQILQGNTWATLLTPRPSPSECTPLELKLNSQISEQWDQTFYEIVDEMTGPKFIRTAIREGTFRFLFDYGLSKDSWSESTIYSNEFTIKEKKNITGFCGWSTHGSCSSDLGCIEGGCSGQVCQSKNEEPIMTTCEWQDCYDDEAYGVECKCVENKCQWTE